MFVSMLCMTLAAGPVQDPSSAKPTGVAAAVNLDGNWTVVCLEKDGQPVADAKGKTVTAKDNTFTCTGKDGKAGMAWAITFRQ